MIIGGVEFQVGSTIKFKTKNAYDTNLYVGVVKGLCDYSIANAFVRDIDAYHLNVAKTATGIGSVEDMDFFLINCETEKNVAFAADWVDIATIALVSFSDTVTIRISDINAATETEIIQKLLTDNGYRNTVIA